MPDPRALMFGPQALIDLDVERSAPIWKCVMCDRETADESRIAQHVMRCGSVVLREHHAMAKTAYLAGLAELERRKSERAESKRAAAVAAAWKSDPTSLAGPLGIGGCGEASPCVGVATSVSERAPAPASLQGE